MPTDDFWADLPSSGRRRTVTTKPTKPAPSPVSNLSSRKDNDSAKPTKSAADVMLSGGRSKWRTALWVIMTLVLMVAFAAVGGAIALWQATGLTMSDSDASPIVFEIRRGETTRSIAESLEESNLIASKWPFLFEILIRGKKIQAGTYSLSPRLSIHEIVEQFVTGNVTSYRVTILEGWRIEQIADYLAELGIVSRSEFLAASVYDPVRYTLPSGIKLEAGASLEGLLFPDTYEFRIGVTSKEIVKTMLDTFAAKTKDLAPTYQAVILASIVEREAKTESERPIIAGIYTNRLAANMKLEADPTVQYGKDTLQAAALDEGKTMTWWQPITASDYQGVSSPWNTYRVTGLPPTPIAAPSLSSLKAAIHPASHDYYFFFHRVDGTPVYSKTKAEHDAARASQ